MASSSKRTGGNPVASAVLVKEEKKQPLSIDLEVSCFIPLLSFPNLFVRFYEVPTEGNRASKQTCTQTQRGAVLAWQESIKGALPGSLLFLS